MKNGESKSYISPIIKIILCLLLLVGVFNRNHLIPIKEWGEKNILVIFIDLIIVVGVFLFAFRVIAKAMSDIGNIHNTRKVKKIDFDKIKESCQRFNLESIIALIKKEEKAEICLFKVVINNSFKEFGAYCDDNRKYYIDDTEYENIEEFTSNLEKISEGNTFLVYSIDDILLKDYDEEYLVNIRLLK